MISTSVRTTSILGVAGLTGIALAACSGSSDAPPPPAPSTLDASNAMTAVSTATAAIGGLADATEGLQGFVPLPIPQPAGFEGEQPLCPDGGTVSVNETDVDPMGELSMGDFYEIVFDQCTTGDLTINGNYGLSIDALTQTETMVSFMMTFSLTSLSVVTPQGSSTQNANLTYGLDVDTNTTAGSSSFSWSLTGSSSSSSTFGGTSAMTVLTGLDFGVTAVIDGEGAWTETAYWNATMETTQGGLGGTALMLATQVDFVFVGLDSVGPTAGMFTLAAGGDTIAVSATGDGVNVLLQLDQRTDGTIDFMDTIAWEDL